MEGLKWLENRKKKWVRVEDRLKILVYCPTYRLQREVVNALVGQKGVDYFDTYFTNDNPHDGEYWGGYKNMMLNWQKMERLAEGYDKVWMVEDDTIPPDDALAKLLEVDALVVSGLFAFRHAPYEPSIQKGFRTQYSWKELGPLDRTITVRGTATGCTLLDKEFLKRYKIDMKGYHDVSKYHEVAQDELLSGFCNREGIEMKCRLDVQCGHVKANGEIIWPRDFIQGDMQ